jgi:hypothetical protein
MRELLRHIATLAMIGFLFGSPAAYVASAATPLHGAGHATHDMGDCHGSGDQKPAAHDPLHCLFFSCSSILFLQTETAPLRIHDRAAAVALRPVDDAPRAAVPERDPPIPRLRA